MEKLTGEGFSKWLEAAIERISAGYFFEYVDHTIDSGYVSVGPSDLLASREAEFKRWPLRPLGRDRSRIVRVALALGHVSDATKSSPRRRGHSTKALPLLGIGSNR